MTVPGFKEVLLNAPQIGPGVRPSHIQVFWQPLWTGEQGFEDLKPNKQRNGEEGQPGKSTTSHKATKQSPAHAVGYCYWPVLLN